MVKTRVLVSTLTVVVIFLAGIGGVAAQETGPEGDTAETAAVAQQEFVSIEVVVVDRSGDPLDDIEVVAEWEGGSDSDATVGTGQALFDVPADADVEFTVNDSDGEFVRNDQPVTRTASEIDGSLTIEMASRGQIEISVVDSDDQPINDARVRLYQTPNNVIAEESTGEDGTTVISGIEQRNYTVDVLRPEYLAAERTINVNESSVTGSVELERSRVNVEFAVLDDYFNESRPLEGARISIGEDRTITTEENGRTEDILHVNTEYDISVSLDGYLDTSETLSVGEEDESLTLTTRRVPSISINQLQDAIVVGQPTQVTITNSYGDPVEGATVDLNDEEVGETNAQGQIVFNITQAGNNTIDASDRGLTASTTLLGVDVDQGNGTDGADGDDTDGTDGDETDGEDGSDSDGEDGSDSDGEDGGDSDGEDGGDGDDAIGPGFGLVAAVGALIAVALIARRRP